MAKGKSNNRSISGEWYGNYYYRGAGQSFGFEAVFIESNGGVEGNILDDGVLGEAKVFGTFVYPNLSFTKRYSSPHKQPVHYTGVLSEDGNSVAGQWEIVLTVQTQDSEKRLVTSGTWTAWRNAEDEDEDTLETQIEKQLDKEKETTKPLVAPAKSG